MAIAANLISVAGFVFYFIFSGSLHTMTGIYFVSPSM